MNPTSQVDEEVEDVADKADLILKGVDPAPFSVPAFSVLKGKVTQYVSDLVTESAAVSRRDQADSISAKHVEIACEHLVSYNRSKVFKHLGTVGGIFFGAFLSTFFTMITSGQYSLSAILVCVLSGVIGAFLLALSVAKE